MGVPSETARQEGEYAGRAEGTRLVGAVLEGVGVVGHGRRPCVCIIALRVAPGARMPSGDQTQQDLHDAAGPFPSAIDVARRRASGRVRVAATRSREGRSGRVRRVHLGMRARMQMRSVRLPPFFRQCQADPGGLRGRRGYRHTRTARPERGVGLRTRDDPRPRRRCGVPRCPARAPRPAAPAVCGRGSRIKRNGPLPIGSGPFAWSG